MLRNGLAALAGMIAAMIVTTLLQFVARFVDPPSPEIMEAVRNIYSEDSAKIEEARQVFARELSKQPLQLVLVIVSHALGTLFGALIAVRASREAHIVPASIVGGLMLMGGIANVMLIPHPTWFNAVDLLVYIPAALLAYRLVVPRATDDPAAGSSEPTHEPTHEQDDGGSTTDITPVAS